MWNAMQALRLNLKHWAEDYPIAARIIMAVLLFTMVFAFISVIRSCMAGWAAAACSPASAAVPAGNEIEVGGCGTESTDASECRRTAIRRKGCLPAGQPPIALQADAPAGIPLLPQDGPGGPCSITLQGVRRFWRATIHHTATPPDNPAERVRQIDADHRSRGWDGVGYHFLVAEDGTVFPGRPLDRQGAHVKGENEGNLGIALIGTYTDRPPPEAALAAVRRLLATWGFGPEAVWFHKDLATTECPGNWPKELLFSPETGSRKPEREAKG